MGLFCFLGKTVLKRQQKTFSLKKLKLRGEMNIFKRFHICCYFAELITSGTGVWFLLSPSAFWKTSDVVFFISSYTLLLSVSAPPSFVSALQEFINFLLFVIISLSTFMAIIRDLQLCLQMNNTDQISHYCAATSSPLWKPPHKETRREQDWIHELRLILTAVGVEVFRHKHVSHDSWVKRCERIIWQQIRCKICFCLLICDNRTVETVGS